jgi:MoxR-like ATPase
MPLPHAAEHLNKALHAHGYIAAPATGLALYLGKHLQKPLLVEGPPGAGKTALAKVAAEVFALPLIRLQCHEGINEHKALYEWKYAKQLLYTQILRDHLKLGMADDPGMSSALEALHRFNDIFYSPEFLEPRPLLKALQSEHGCVLLIDEIDKADEEFEAFLLEILSDHQISIPELGTVAARCPPLVILTSNDTRELGDALRRRCLHVHMPLPDLKTECAIVRAHLPDLDDTLTRQVVGFVQTLRTLPLRKHPSVSETLDWARTLLLLNVGTLDTSWIEMTLSTLLKHASDTEEVRNHLPRLFGETLR